MDFKETKKDLEKKYRKEIEGIAGRNNVDMGVAFDMLSTNALHGGKYEGGGVPADWKGLQDDFKKLQSSAITSSTKNKDRTTTNSRGEEVFVSDLAMGEVKKKIVLEQSEDLEDLEEF